MVEFEWSGPCIFRLLCMGLRPLCTGLRPLCLRNLRFSIHWVVWSRRQPLAGVGAVLGLLDGPSGCDPALCVVLFRCRLLCKYLALRPTEVGRVYRILEMVGEGSPGHGPVHLLSSSAAEIGFRWDPIRMGWSRPGLHLLRNLADPLQHFKAAILDAWRNKVAADLCAREGFRGGPFAGCAWRFAAPSHVREWDKALLRSVMVGCVWNGFLLGRVGVSLCRAGSVVLLMVTGIFLGNAPFLLLLRFVKILNFTISSEWIRLIGRADCFGMAGFLCFLV